MSRAIIILILALALFGIFLVVYNSETVSNSIQDNSNTLDTPQKWESKTDDQLAVTVTVSPLDISLQSKEWKFNIVMSTHSVELDQDMIKIAVLVDDSGKEYSPIRWEGAPAGGHHREGILFFAPITPYPQHLTLSIKDIGGVQRSFSWILTE
ncbi:MAG: hypothetical protein A2665_02175 [Candidatus Zambryskibacteria bacterium RIFCSPHIGHO2_01_FULL_46_30]|uniref:DUF4352 domain-containing protein n=1 Tax=Candidatus Zambryskibacteria bacterium RIFCSPHIGHO2_01_FULL_46_30 TaxID=1802739 RepID=A0A1G2T0V8_9BACT|nr:MAG: hypothetical protein A2665_02175 [Candidatus Zambryskibacteria bacterium RIFCSPHIGHO2_01_FULL_46_30]OHB05432.1 MAG: hypothetical protein A3B22_00390 [Candidatus Zambryskibacteria bacterium RIFCSPLOWO2_01_FULL_47_33]